ncbi:MAG: M48 family metallopeptidase [Candidatus Micrarchaeaceae archaeon]
MEFPPVELGGRAFGVRIVLKRNRNAYARVRNGCIIISLPSRMDKQSAYKTASCLYSRIKDDMSRRPQRYLQGGYPLFRDGDSIEIMGRAFLFHVSCNGASRPRAHASGSDIYIELPGSLDDDARSRESSRAGAAMLSRLLSDDVDCYVRRINEAHFGSDIESVRITRASTMWGYCTRGKGNAYKIFINFRLLLMPKECMEYVAVHELAHTRVKGHTRGFWGIVGGIMPDYKERKSMLKTAGDANIGQNRRTSASMSSPQSPSGI